MKEFKGYLHTDGYKAYRGIENVTIVGCWAHARRRFCEALEVLPEAQRKGSTAAIGLDYCGKLYELEKKMKDASPKDKLKERQEQAKPLLDAFFAWAKSLRNIAPKSKLGKAPTLKDNESIDILLPWNAPDDCRSKSASSTE